jgi:hypothetical protein
MFDKFANIKDQNERLEVYNLLRFNLSACLRLAEFMAIAILISGLAWFISAESARLFSSALGPRVSAGIGILFMILVPALVRLPFLLARGRLMAAFKLDPRPESARLKEIFNLGLRRAAVLCLLSISVHAAMVKLDLWQWTALLLILGLVLVTFNSFFPRILSPENLRPLRGDDLGPELLARVEAWKPKTGFPIESILVSSSFCPDLSFPRLTGLGPTAKLVVHEKALASFPPRELSILVLTGVLDSLVNAPLKFMLLRFCSLLVAVPLASILISTIGISFWGYPAITNPALVTLVWAAAWVGLNIADFTIRFTGRSLTVQLAAAAAMALKDESSLETALATMAKRNLEDEAPSGWRELFRRQYTRLAFLKRVRYHQHMARFSDRG